MKINLTRLREQRGWSKSELARRAGLNQSTVSAVENGRAVPYDSQLEKLASALGVSGHEHLLDEAAQDDQ